MEKIPTRLEISISTISFSQSYVTLSDNFDQTIGEPDKYHKEDDLVEHLIRTAKTDTHIQRPFDFDYRDFVLQELSPLKNDFLKIGWFKDLESNSTL